MMWTAGRKSMMAAVVAVAVNGAAAVSAADTATVIFEPMMRTLTVTANGNLMADPVLRLGSNDRIVFSFDEIGDDWRYLRCRLLHCNADWQPSSLVESEYVDGFNYASIEDYAFSRDTYIHYVNYRFELGGGELRPIVSGNYLWQVYDESDPDTVLLQARFRVSEENCRVTGKADGQGVQYRMAAAESAADAGFARYRQSLYRHDCGSHSERASRHIPHDFASSACGR